MEQRDIIVRWWRIRADTNHSSNSLCLMKPIWQLAQGNRRSSVEEPTNYAKSPHGVSIMTSIKCGEFWKMKKSSSPSIPILISNASTCWCTTRNRKIVGTKRLASNKFTQVQAPRKHLSWAFKSVLSSKWKMRWEENSAKNNV